MRVSKTVRRASLVAPVLLGLLLATGEVRATWSIVLVDTVTKEVATGSVTCLMDDNLEWVPVIVVGKGAAAVQAYSDPDGSRRAIIFEEFMAGTEPDEILDLLSVVPLHEYLQYGLGDTLGRVTTFTGSEVYASSMFADGVTGQQGSMAYSIQGNVLAGSCVLQGMENAVLGATGDLAAKLMAGMEVARARGGDGRCSCTTFAPASCGCPPLSFTKSGHIGYMIVARVGDTDDSDCTSIGCADGDYFMLHNVAWQGWSDPDPVLQLQDMYDAWRTDLIGRPDAVQSQVSLVETGGVQEMTIELRDWQGEPVTVPILDLSVTHEPESAGVSTIGVPQDLGGGVYLVTLTPEGGGGYDRLRITVDDGIRPVVLAPSPALCAYDPAGAFEDCNLNGLPDECELASGIGTDDNGNGMLDECEIFIRGDTNADGVLDVGDAITILNYLFLFTPVTCLSAQDVNDDSGVDIADPIHSLSYQFSGGAAPPPPLQDCGTDPSADLLGCLDFAACP